MKVLILSNDNIKGLYEVYLHSSSFTKLESF